MSPSRGVHLNDHETGLVAGLVRDAVRRNWKNRRRAEKKFAEHFSPEPYVNKECLLFDIYRKLGKNPADISERGDKT